MKNAAELTTTMRRGEIIAAVVLLLLSAGIIAGAWEMPVGSAAQPGAAIFPLGLGFLLGLISLGLLLRAVRLSGEEAAEPVQIGHPQIWLTLFILFIVGLVFDWLGYLISATLLMAVLLRSYSTLRWHVVLLAAVGASIVSWLIFSQLLDASLPMGVLEPLLR